MPATTENNDDSGSDILGQVVGRQVQVQPSWFGEEWCEDNPNQLYILDIKEVLPATRGLRRRLLHMYEDMEEYFLLPLQSVNPPVQSSQMTGPLVQFASTFQKIPARIVFNEETESYTLQGKNKNIQYLHPILIRY